MPPCVVLRHVFFRTAYHLTCVSTGLKNQVQESTIRLLLLLMMLMPCFEAENCQQISSRDFYPCSCWLQQYPNRLQCFSQPTNLITYRKTQRSRQLRTNLKSCMWSCCAKKEFMVLVSVHSKVTCISSATATLPQCVQTLLTLATCWPPATQPRTIGNWWEPVFLFFKATIHWFVNSLVHSLHCSFMHPFIHLCTHPTISSCILSSNQYSSAPRFRCVQVWLAPSTKSCFVCISQGSFTPSPEAPWWPD